MTRVGGHTVGGDTVAGGDDLLAKIQADGEIVVSTDPAYPPQSELNPTTNEYEGFVADVQRAALRRDQALLAGRALVLLRCPM